MKRILFSALALTAFVGAGGMVQAQEAEELEVFVYRLKGDQATLFAGSSVNGVSRNGKYAVGHGVEYSDKAFIWDSDSREFKQITGSANDNEACAYGVSNDGTVVGTFAWDNNGASKSVAIVPGYWKNGTWTMLELESKNIYQGEANGEACYISPDGRVITGYVKGTYKKNFYDLDGFVTETRDVELYRPAVWIDGKLQPLEERPNGETLQQGMFAMAYSASEDGSVLGGFADFETGSQSPAIWVDGKLTRLYLTEDIDPDTATYFPAGRVAAVSANGKYAGGYYDDSGNGYNAIPFIYNVETGETEELDKSWQAVTYLQNDGTAYLMPAGVRENGNAMTLTNYLKTKWGYQGGNLPSVIFGVSEDGMTIGGYAVAASELGQMMDPVVVLVAKKGSGIESVSDAAGKILLNGRTVVAEGAESIEVFDAAGRQLAHSNSEAVTVEGYNGLAIVKAVTADGKSQTAKLVIK